MAKTKTLKQEFMENYRTAKAKQDAARARKRAQRAMEGPPSVRAAAFITRWMKRIFYTFFMFMALYLIVVMFTLMLPAVMALLIGAMGYTLASMGEIMLTAFAGIFFTLWAFAVSLFIVWRIGKVYMQAMASTKKKTDAEE